MSRRISEGIKLTGLTSKNRKAFTTSEPSGGVRGGFFRCPGIYVRDGGEGSTANAPKPHLIAITADLVHVKPLGQNQQVSVWIEEVVDVVVNGLADSRHLLRRLHRACPCPKRGQTQALRSGLLGTDGPKAHRVLLISFPCVLAATTKNCLCRAHAIGSLGASGSTQVRHKEQIDRILFPLSLHSNLN
jgi:hypothetical protein